MIAHRSTSPIMVATTTAQINVSGTNRRVNRAPKAARCCKINLMSTIGPTVKKTNREANENCPIAAAKNASASLHTDSTTARNAMTAMLVIVCSAAPSTHPTGTMVRMAVVASAPTTKKPPAYTKSPFTTDTKTASFDS